LFIIHHRDTEITEEKMFLRSGDPDRRNPRHLWKNTGSFYHDRFHRARKSTLGRHRGLFSLGGISRPM